MRVIFEDCEGDYFLEIQLDDEDIKKLSVATKISSGYVWDKKRNLNLLLMKVENATSKRKSR